MTRVLIVLTNIEKYETINRATGLWLSELTHFYDEVKAANFEVDFVSPKGGFVPLDPSSMQYVDETDFKYYGNSDFRKAALAESLTPEQVDASKYDVIYYTGGHGTMWHFPNSEALDTIASQIYAHGGLVSSVCHGAAGLLHIKDTNGQNLIAGKVLTGFSNEEEAANGTTEAVPFLTEDELKAAGADYQAGPAFNSIVKIDGRLITGQNPQSARAVGQAFVEFFK